MMRVVRRFGPLLLLLLLVVWALCRLDLKAFAHSLQYSHISLWVLAALVNVAVRAGVRAERTRGLLRSVPGRLPRFLGLYLDLVSAQAATALWPPAGMGFRLLVLRQHYGFASTDLVGEQLIEKLLDGMSLGLWGFCALLSGPLPSALRLAVWVACLLGVAAGLGLVLSKLPALRRRLPPLPRIAPSGWVWTAALDGFDMLMLELCLRASGVQVSLHVLLLLFVALNLAVLLPLTPAGFGVVEATVMLVLKPLGVSAETALAGALLYHLAVVGPFLLLGPLASVREVFVQARAAQSPALAAAPSVEPSVEASIEPSAEPRHRPPREE